MLEAASIAFSRVTEIPYVFRKEMVDRLGSISAVLNQEWSESAHMNKVLRTHLNLRAAEDEVRRLKKMGAWLKIYGEPGYPKLLTQISNPPFVIFGLGDFPSEENYFLSVVGPRRASTYGLRVGRWLTQDVVDEGLIIISGMARGIDAMAHETALAAKKETIAVMACGLDKTYPPEHAAMKAKILKSGAVITEFGLGEPPRAEHFPQRNRIISGLSKGILVIEAAEKSGARISARHAIEQSRDVYAVPGPIDSATSMFTNQLIAQGAKLVASSADILEDYFPEKNFRESKENKPKDLAPLSAEEEAILSLLTDSEELGIDEIIARGNLPTPSVLGALVELEMKGRVAKQNNARYVRVLL